MEFVTDFHFFFSKLRYFTYLHHPSPSKLPANLIYFFVKESPLFLCETPWGRGYGQNHWQTAETGFRQNAVIHSK